MASSNSVYQNEYWKGIIKEITPVIKKAIHKHFYSKDVLLIQDVEQEIIIKVYNKFALYQPEKSLKDWVYVLAVNHIFDVLRKLKRKSFLDDQFTMVQETISGESPASDVSSKQLLNQLPLKYRDVLTRKYIHGYKQKEIAEQLGLPIGTVSTHIQSGIKLLRKLIQKDSLTCSDFL